MKIFNLLFRSGKGVCAEKWKEFKSRYYIVYYNNASLNFVKTVKINAENDYGEISRSIGLPRYKGCTDGTRIRIYVYDSADDYVTGSNQSGWSHGAASPNEKIIRTFPTAHGFFDSTLPHELGHIVFRQYLGYRVRIPLWFEEGFAMQQEKAKRWGADGLVRKAIDNNVFISLDDLSLLRLSDSSNTALVDLFYAESASVVGFLSSKGRNKFNRFLRKMSKGESFEQALQAVYFRFKSIDHLNKAWKKYLGNG